MQESIKILDHGYLKYIEHYGSDERIVEAARMSTGKGFQGWGPSECKSCNGRGSVNVLDGPNGRPFISTCDECKGKGEISGDEKLLRYLYSNYHDTPFEMAGLVIEVQAPIMVFREWHRHRTQSYNEMSARYIPLPDLNYVPTVERLMLNSKTNKQAGTVKGSEELTESGAKLFQSVLECRYRDAQLSYEESLSSGVPKELARLCIPVGRYSRMRANANLRNWLAFMTLRSDKSAQYEIRQYSIALGTIIAELFPRTWALFAEWFEKKSPRLV